ncbi:AAA family ATPase [uncultured Brachyspira sp.]|uniref:AAA family ATPase n=1 Tax=uncultured Brachyspira sp. TaxID=221953 RepID=UPI0026247ED6|nr:AAA family ATPase [uncultured Brachyspira sp.]
MSNSIKELYEINKNDIHNNNSSYKLLYDELLDKLNRFEIKDDNLNTFYIYIVYSPNDFKNISNRGNIIYAYEKEVEFNSEQEIKISLFKTQIDFIEKNIIKENKLDVKVIIAFNCKKEVIENKYFINTDNSKKEEVKLNVFPIEPKYNMSQIILNDSTFEEIQKVSTLIKNIQKIYYDWGFSEIDPVPRCIVNFYGPPGTGKTMSAHIIASELNTKILPLNYSDIESKFVGDAPKNLVQAFEIAKRENCLLFF